jgi:L-lactate dehydrogenase complex protein LldF
MNKAFKKRIRTALANPALQSALDRNAERRVAGRNQRLAELPQAEQVRDQARAIRQEVLAHLDEYLAEFTANVRARGGQVHRAADAAEARRIILGIAQAAGAAHGPGRAPLVAKSKSMVSEEVDLNHALTESGARVVETDLGEFIVQLRGEPPSHIITPAVHLRRQDVSALFTERFGLPPTDDVEAMTTLARGELRRVFFGADVGFSGVNFGVASTGALCLVTNEGNGRLCTTVPRVHVALMGLERLVPGPAELEVLLRLLPRSATAQKLSSYVSMLAGPRRLGEPDGPEALHVVLLDNGRTQLLGTELEEALLCIRCGACLNVCPVYREIGGHAYGSVYGGPIGSVISAPLMGEPFAELAHASTLCGACRDICPVRIDLPRMLLAVRGQSVEAGQPPAWLKAGMAAFTWAAMRPGRFRLAQRAAAAATRLLARQGWVRALPAPLDAWTHRRDFPAFADETFRQRWQKRQAASLPVDNVIPLEPMPRQTPEASESQASAPAPAPVALSPTERFAAELTAVGGEFVAVPAGQVAGTIARWLRESGMAEVLAWEARWLPVPGLLAELASEGITIADGDLPHAEPARSEALARLEPMRAGLTGADAALADTGSLALGGGPGRPRLASLSVHTHIALFTPAQLYASWAAWLVEHPLAAGWHSQTSALTLITGPSRTADIEMTLTMGVHGPRRVVAVLVS